MSPRFTIALLSLVAGCQGVPPPGPQRPNFVILYTDDQGYGDFSAQNPRCGFQTPNMDRLAAEGMTFADGHSASSVCTPSRYALLTGRYPWRTRLKSGVLGADADCLIAAERWTLGSMLQGLGYTTAAFGKWHLGMQIPGEKGDRDWSQPVLEGPLQRGFDEFYGIPASMNFGVLTWIDGDRVVAPADLWTRKTVPESEIVTRPLDYRFVPPFDREPRGPADIEIAATFRDSEVLRVTAERAVAFLENRGDAPFFLYVALTSPHLPHCTAEEFRGRSGMGNYGDFMLETDARIGQVLDALQRTGAARDTVVILTSDNGPENNYKDWIERYGHHANGPWRGGKRDLYEGGHRVPFVVRWPGVVAKNSKSTALVGQVDLLATVAEIVGTAIPTGHAEDSESFVGALMGGDGSRTAMVHHSGSGQFGYRSHQWKLVFRRGAPAPPPELYDLATDPGELRDVAADHPEVVEQLVRELTATIAAGRTPAGAVPGEEQQAAWWPQLSWLRRP